MYIANAQTGQWEHISFPEQLRHTSPRTTPCHAVAYGQNTRNTETFGPLDSLCGTNKSLLSSGKAILSRNTRMRWMN